jgi:uncharacterized membrane protein
MQNHNPTPPDAAEGPATGPRFAATLVPSHILPPKGFLALLLNIAALSYLSVYVFFFLGMGWLAGLWLLNAALCCGVYLWKYAPGRLQEKVVLTKERLSVIRTGPSGKAESWDFHPYWVRCELRKCQGNSNELSLSSHGRKLAFGTFLSDREKENLATALGAALAAQKSRGLAQGDRA